MRVLAPVVGGLLIAAKAAIACRVVEVVGTQPASSNVRLSALKEDTRRESASFVANLQFNAQQVGPPLKTDNRGDAELRNLASGTYPVTVAADGKLGAVSWLTVSKGNADKRSEITLNLAPLPPPPPTLAEQLAEAAKSPPETRARPALGRVSWVLQLRRPNLRSLHGSYYK